MVVGNDPEHLRPPGGGRHTRPPVTPSPERPPTGSTAPCRRAERIATYQQVSEYQTLVGDTGFERSQFGNLLILPFGDSLLYLRPVYVRQESSAAQHPLTRIAVTAGGDGRLRRDRRRGHGGPRRRRPAAGQDGDQPAEPPGEPGEPSENGEESRRRRSRTGLPRRSWPRRTRCSTEADEALTDGDLGALPGHGGPRPVSLVIEATGALGPGSPAAAQPRATAPVAEGGVLTRPRPRRP